MLLIYSELLNPRVRYAFTMVLNTILGLEISFSQDKDFFNAYTGPKLSYGKAPMGSVLFFGSSHLLYEKGITEQQINVFEWNKIKAFFPVTREAVIPFDPFAASFYLVVRYEEYLPHIRDTHERFLPKESLAFQNDFLKVPLVNVWAGHIKTILIQHFPLLSFQKRKFEFVSTFDIDNAYAYLEKGFMRTTAAYIKSLCHLNLKEIKARTLVLLGLQKDPFDTYQDQLALSEKYKFKSLYFFLVGAYGMYDKNTSLHSRKFQSLIKSIADYASVGIHPSYGSNKDPLRIRKETGKLSKVLKREVFQSRQHFLKLYLPLTYRRLIDLDIREDYSMGYASEIGFRASICTPFYFYDLDTEAATDLKVFPFVIMDTTLRQYMNLKAESIIETIKPIIDEIKKADGTFISLWHNESLSDVGIWYGWKIVYQNIIEEALKA
jgi:hypothetical protein